MTKNEQKERERAIAKYYIHNCKIAGDINDGSERPDFILSCENGKKIGVEIIEYHRPKEDLENYSPMQIGSEIKKLINKSSIYRTDKTNADIKFLQVEMRFRDGIAPPSKCHDEFIQAVYYSIRSLEIPKNKNFVDVKLESTRKPILVDYLNELRVAKTDLYLDWQCADVIQTVISSEENLISFLSSKLNMKYKIKLDELHLVLFGFGQYDFHYIGDTRKDNLNEWRDMKKFLEFSQWDVLAIINPPESVVWRKSDRYWEKLCGNYGRPPL